MIGGYISRCHERSSGPCVPSSSPQDSYRPKLVFWSTIIVGIVCVLSCISGSRAFAVERGGPVKSLLEIRHQDVITQKFDLSCGAAALATLLTYQYGDRVTERQVAEGLIRRKVYIEHPELLRIRQGFSLLDMKRYVDSRGYVGIGYGKLEFKDIIPLAPLIVAIRPVGYNHFVIFRGVSNNQVLLADPAFGNRTMSVEKFNRVWIDFPKFGRVGFVVTRKGKQAPPGRLAPLPDLFVAPPAVFVRQAIP